MDLEKFVISTDTGDIIELHYADVKTKKLVKYCKTTSIKSLTYAGVIMFVIGAIVSVYDFFKDIGRTVSAIRDLLNSTEGGFAKYMGFTKDNIVRTVIKYGIFILGFVLLYLSSSLGTKICYQDPDLLAEMEKLIVYNQEEIPIKIEVKE